jgi:iron(II)-dependent oxidoreductase
VRYFAEYAVFHEDMHDEAFTYTRQTLGYPPPRLALTPPPASAGPLAGDARCDGGQMLLGAPRDAPFVFDNEKWGHDVEIAPFSIARAPVTQAEFAAFVEDGGYQREPLWGASGWEWRTAEGALHPVYWRGSASGWERRNFDSWVPLEPHRPVIHVNWYEAMAYCRWAARRLPTEVEWEAAAALEPGGRKRRFPWGEGPPDPERANLDAGRLGCVDVGALPAGDSAIGCRQMIGNVWEWTQSPLTPYPGFVADAYAEYSQPWFHTHKVLRGGCWVTRSRLLRNTWRNFYMPDRRDVLAGFRTCAA